MKKILLIVIIALTYSAMTFAQSKEPAPIADETFIKTTKTSFAVYTAGESIKNLILKRFKDIKSYTVVRKKDRMGEYWEYVFRFKLEKHPEVEAFLKSL